MGILIYLRTSLHYLEMTSLVPMIWGILYYCRRLHIDLTHAFLLTPTHPNPTPKWRQWSSFGHGALRGAREGQETDWLCPASLHHLPGGGRRQALFTELRSVTYRKIPETGLIRHGWCFFISHVNIKFSHVLAILNHVSQSRTWSQILITNLITNCDQIDHTLWSSWSHFVIKLITFCDQVDHKMWSKKWSQISNIVMSGNVIVVVRPHHSHG